MRLTVVLYRQHIGRMFKRHWLTQGVRTPIDTNAQSFLVSKGFQVTEANEFLNERLGM